jgi:adenylate cyclase
MSLGKSIVLLLVALLVGTTLLVGGVAWFTTRSSIKALRHSVLSQIDARVQARMQDYFDQAEPALAFMQHEAICRPGILGDDWESGAVTLLHYLQSQRNLVWIYYGDEANGDLLGALKDSKGHYQVSRVSERNGRVAEVFDLGEDGRLHPAESYEGSDDPYDARTRPWYLAAKEIDGVTWTSPYQFLSREVVGITAAVARRDADGELLGVFAADLTLEDLGGFLDQFEVGENGAAFLILEDGTFVVPQEARKRRNIPALRKALATQAVEGLPGLKSMKPIEQYFTSDGIDYMGLVQPLDLPGGTRYYAGVVVPESDYLGVVTRNAWFTVAAAVGILILAISLGTWVARRVTGPLAVIGQELESIGNLRFREEGLYLRSNIREIALFSDSVGKMKVSLRAFSKYVPRDLVRLLLSHGNEAKLGGSLRKITVVFTDLAGFTGMSEALSADEAFTELSAFLEIVAETQQRHGGITSNFTGDGTLALFNAPEALPNHEEKACLAALDCVEALRILNGVREAAGKAPFRARIGINTAEVLLGNLGTHERFAYTAIGDGVNLASRIEGLGKLYGTEILAGNDCRSRVAEAIEWRRIDRIAVMGRNSAVEIFEPLGRKGGVSDEILSARDRYEAALEAYFAARFHDAAAAFDEALALSPRDPTAKVMAARCREFEENGVPADWDGTFVMPFK